jgi:hypothetical protein
MLFTHKPVALLAMACLASSAFAMTSAEYKAAKQQIEAQYKAEKLQCQSLAGNARDICKKEAEGREDVAEAELKAQHKPGPKADRKLAETRAKAVYEVAKERCDDLSGNPKAVCEKDAKAAYVHAKQGAKVRETARTDYRSDAARGAAVAEARKDAAAETREADYKAAKERCEVLAGDSKSQCVDDAKRRYGQN